MGRNFSELIDEFFLDKRKDDKIALYQKRFSGLKTITFYDFKKSVYETSQKLKNRGLNENDNVLILLPFSIEMYVSVISVLINGGNVFFIEPWMDKNFLKKIIDENIKFVITDIKGEIFLRMNNIKSNFIHIDLKSNINPRDVNLNIKYGSIITFTTGSSGIPTMVKRTHKDLYIQLQRLERHIEDGDFVDFVTFPNLVLLNLYKKRTTIIPSIFLNSHFFDYALNKLNLSRIFVNPYFGENFLRKSICDKLKKIYIGGSIVPVRLLNEFSIAGKTKIFYGCTQIEPISVVSGKDYVEYSVDGYYLGRIEKDIDYKIEYIEKDIGTLYVRLNDGEWVNTKDVVKVEKEGIKIIGREMDIFKINDKFIYPYLLQRRFEDTVKTLFPIKYNEELVIAIEGNKSKEIYKKVAEKIEDIYGVKPVVKFLNKIPKDPRQRGKIDVKKLRKIIMT